MTRPRLDVAPVLRELRLLVAPALGDWSKVLQIVVILFVLLAGAAILFLVGAMAVGSLPWPAAWRTNWRA